jgi:hypothetical protein
MRALPWFWRELLKVSAFPLLAFGLLAIACLEAAGEGARGWGAFAVGIGGGALGSGYERFRAWRRNELFIRDPAQVATRRARAREVSASILGPAVGLAVAVTVFPGLLRIVLFALGAGYLVPMSILVVVHFALHHEEIERIASLGDR